MKLRYLASILGALCSLLHAHAQPLPARQTTLPGTYRISAGTQLSYETPLAPLAGYLREYINVGKASDSMSADDAIVLTTDPTLGREAYTLAVKPQRIEITGGDYGGVFNGIQALLRLLPPEVYAKACPLPVEVACTRIDDAPRFAYRGMMLDVARTWIGVDGVKRYIDLLSYHGINKLHLHLSDDEGWRIEIRSHPELTEIGGFRGGDSPVKAIYGKWFERYGGYYTQEEMRELIIHERRMELAFEGHRWFDLVRIDNGDYAIEFLQSIGKSVTRERLLLPIPQTEIDSNSAMTQNPGY